MPHSILVQVMLIAEHYLKRQAKSDFSTDNLFHNMFQLKHLIGILS